MSRKMMSDLDNKTGYYGYSSELGNVSGKDKKKKENKGGSDVLRQGIEITRKGGNHFLNATDLVTVNWNDYRTIMPIPQAVF